jgi:hypothetical protein
LPIKPHPSDKFRPNTIKKIIEPYLKETLKNVRTYVADDAQNLCKRMSTEIREKIKKLNLQRYK